MNIKLFKIITNKNEAKTIAKLLSYDCKYKFNSANCKSTKNGIMINANASVKRIVSAKKIIAGTLAHIFVRIGSI